MPRRASLLAGWMAAAASIVVVSGTASAARAAILTGIDVLEREDFTPLAGRRVGLITNHTGLDARGRSTVDVLFHSNKVNLVAIFTPEHGYRGDADGGQGVGDTADPATGVPIYSLYGARRRPTDELLQNVDVLVFDVQDVGARFYTYLTTMAYAMEEAAKRGIGFVVLDRPNPITGDILEGPVYDGPPEFTAYFPVPVRHGMTAGEMARLHAGERGLGVRLTVIPMEGWTRGMYYDDTGYSWVDPSPNIRGVEAALLYPAIGCFESTDISVGRGTDSPFTWFGAPWLDAARLAAELNAAGLAGARFWAEDKIPAADIYHGRLCHGVHIEITDRARVRPMDIFVTAVAAMRGMPARPFMGQPAGSVIAAGANVFKMVYVSKDSPREILAGFAESWKKFEASRRRYLLYP